MPTCQDLAQQLQAGYQMCLNISAGIQEWALLRQQRAWWDLHPGPECQDWRRQIRGCQIPGRPSKWWSFPIPVLWQKHWCSRARHWPLWSPTLHRTTPWEIWQPEAQAGPHWIQRALQEERRCSKIWQPAKATTSCRFFSRPTRNVPSPTGPKDRRGPPDFWCNADGVYGALWWLQEQTRSRDAYVDAGSCSRCWCCWQPSSDEGISRTDTGEFGSGDVGWFMERGLGLVVARGATQQCFYGQIFSFICSWKALLSLGPISVECSDVGLFERGRTASFEEERGTSREAKSCKNSRTRSAVVEATAISEENSVPSQAKARNRFASKGQLRPCDQVGDVPRSDFGLRKAQDPTAHDVMRSSDLSPPHLIAKDKSPHRPGGVPPTSSLINCTSRSNQVSHDSAACNAVVEPPIQTQLHSFEEMSTCSLSYPKWCSELLSMVLKTRNPFSAFVAKSVPLTRLPRDEAKPTPTFFPIPYPCFGVFGRMPSGVSGSAKHTRHLNMVVHLVVCALNFWFCGGKFGPLSKMRRKPNEQHQALFCRVRLLIESDGLTEVNGLPSAGRRFPELVARLSELSDAITRLGVTSSAYDKTFPGTAEAPMDNSKHEALQPYHDADPDKLRLSEEAPGIPAPFSVTICAWPSGNRLW